MKSSKKNRASGSRNEKKSSPSNILDYWNDTSARVENVRPTDVIDSFWSSHYGDDCPYRGRAAKLHEAANFQPHDRKQDQANNYAKLMIKSRNYAAIKTETPALPQSHNVKRWPEASQDVRPRGGPYDCAAAPVIKKRLAAPRSSNLLKSRPNSAAGGIEAASNRSNNVSPTFTRQADTAQRPNTRPNTAGASRKLGGKSARRGTPSNTRPNSAAASRPASAKMYSSSARKQQDKQPSAAPNSDEKPSKELQTVIERAILQSLRDYRMVQTGQSENRLSDGKNSPNYGHGSPANRNNVGNVKSHPPGFADSGDNYHYSPVYTNRQDDVSGYHVPYNNQDEVAKRNLFLGIDEANAADSDEALLVGQHIFPSNRPRVAPANARHSSETASNNSHNVVISGKTNTGMIQDQDGISMDPAYEPLEGSAVPEVQTKEVAASKGFFTNISSKISSWTGGTGKSLSNKTPTGSTRISTQDNVEGTSNTSATGGYGKGLFSRAFNFGGSSSRPQSATVVPMQDNMSAGDTNEHIEDVVPHFVQQKQALYPFDNNFADTLSPNTSIMDRKVPTKEERPFHQEYKFTNNHDHGIDIKKERPKLIVTTDADQASASKGSKKSKAVSKLETHAVSNPIDTKQAPQHHSKLPRVVDTTVQSEASADVANILVIEHESDSNIPVVQQEEINYSVAVNGVSEVPEVEVKTDDVTVEQPTTVNELDAKFDKYIKMKKMLPEGAVRHKMKGDGFSEGDINGFFAGELPKSASIVDTPKGAAAVDLDKYVLAVRQKMHLDGFSRDEVESCFAPKISTAVEIPDLENYVAMKKFLAEGVVKKRMKADGVCDADIKAFFAGKQCIDAPPKVVKPDLDNYRVMKSFLAEGVVRHRMTSDGFSDQEIDSFFFGDLDKKTENGMNPALEQYVGAIKHKMTLDGFSALEIKNCFNKSKANDAAEPDLNEVIVKANLDKYTKLKKILPEMAVRHKMTGDGISESDINDFFNGNKENTITSTVSAPTSKEPMKKAGPFGGSGDFMAALNAKKDALKSSKTNDTSSAELAMMKAANDARNVGADANWSQFISDLQSSEVNVVDSCEYYVLPTEGKQAVGVDNDVNVLDTIGEFPFLLGRGKFAAVYKASKREGRKSSSDEEPVALKIAQYKYFSSLDNSSLEENKVLCPPLSCIEEYAREILAMRQLCSAVNILQMKGVVLHPLSIVLEYAPFGSLSDSLENDDWQMHNGVLERVRILQGIAAGLSHMHILRYLHRDMKPHNIMLMQTVNETNPNKPGEIIAKIGDFGTAIKLPMETSEVCSDIVGTLGYTAPEIYNPGKYSFPADVFACAIIMWQTFSVDRDNPLATVNNPFANNVRPILDTEHPPLVAQLIESCWATEPQNRLTAPVLQEIFSDILSSPAKFRLIRKTRNLDAYGVPNVVKATMIPSSSSWSCEVPIAREMGKVMNEATVTEEPSVTASTASSHINPANEIQMPTTISEISSEKDSSVVSKLEFASPTSDPTNENNVPTKPSGGIISRFGAHLVKTLSSPRMSSPRSLFTSSQSNKVHPV